MLFTERFMCEEREEEIMKVNTRKKVNAKDFVYIHGCNYDNEFYSIIDITCRCGNG